MCGPCRRTPISPCSCSGGQPEEETVALSTEPRESCPVHQPWELRAGGAVRTRTGAKAGDSWAPVSTLPNPLPGFPKDRLLGGVRRL